MSLSAGRGTPTAMVEVGASVCCDVEVSVCLDVEASVCCDVEVSVCCDVEVSVCCEVDASLVIRHGPETVTKLVAMTVSKTTSSASFGVGKDSGAGAGGPLYELIQDTRCPSIVAITMSPTARLASASRCC